MNGVTEKIGYTKDVGDIGVLYCKSNNNIYFISDSQIYSFQDMQAPYQLSAYLPIQLWRNENCILLNDELYGCVHQNMLILRALDQPELAQGALSIIGGDGSVAHKNFISNHHEVAITMSHNNYSTVSDFATDIISGENAIDIIILSCSDYPIEQIINKGYVADLSDYPQIVDTASQMNPALTSCLMRDSKLYGIPMHVKSYGMGYDISLANGPGLSQEDLPTTYLELLEFIANFQYAYGEEHPEVNLFGNFNFKEIVFTNMLSRYTSELLRNGEKLHFDTPLFRKLITVNDFYEKQALLWNDVAFEGPYQFREIRSTQPLILPLDEGMQPLAESQVLAFFVNARTEHMDQAILYLAEYIREFNPYTSFALFPSMNDPVPNPDYDGLVKEYENYIARLETRLKTADAENKSELKNRLAGAQAGLAEKVGLRPCRKRKGLQSATPFLRSAQKPIN